MASVLNARYLLLPLQVNAKWAAELIDAVAAVDNLDADDMHILVWAIDRMGLEPSAALAAEVSKRAATMLPDLRRDQLAAVIKVQCQVRRFDRFMSLHDWKWLGRNYFGHSHSKK